MKKKSLNDSLASRSGLPASAVAASTAEPVAQAATQASQAPLPDGSSHEAFITQVQQAFDQIQANYNPKQLTTIRHLVTAELYRAFEEDVADVSDYDSKPFFKHLNAEVIDTVDEDGQYIASVKIRGDIDEANQRSEPFREIWHFTKQKGSHDWLLAGIEPY